METDVTTQVEAVKTAFATAKAALDAIEAVATAQDADLVQKRAFLATGRAALQAFGV